MWRIWKKAEAFDRSYLKTAFGNQEGLCDFRQATFAV